MFTNIKLTRPENNTYCFQDLFTVPGTVKVLKQTNLTKLNLTNITLLVNKIMQFEQTELITPVIDHT